MFKHITVKKKLSVFIVALFVISFATGTYFSYDQGYAHGYIQGLAEAGGTPTIDGAEGISDMPWVNATAANFEEFYLNSEDKTDLFEYPELGASYVVFKSGSTYYAKNGGTSKIEFYGSNFWDVMNSCISSGVHINIKAGEYVLNSPIYVSSSNVIITGAGNATIIIYHYHGAAAFTIQPPNPTDRIENIQIKNIGFDGYCDSENHMISSGNCSNILIVGCVFKNVGDESISLGSGTKYAIVRNNWFYNSPSNDVNGAAICLQSGSHLIEGNYILMNGSIRAKGIHSEAILTVGDVSWNKIIGNMIINPSAGIELTTTTYDNFEHIISDNIIINASIAGITDSLSGAQKSYRLTITSNQILGGGTDESATHAISIVKNNPFSVIVTGNIIENWALSSDDSGIVVYANNSIVANNIITNVGDGGISIAGSHVSITGNTVKNYGLHSGVKVGIRIYQGYCTVIGNTIENGYRGIRLESTSSNTIVTGNILYDISIPVDDQSGNLNKIYDNIGFITENIGESTVLSGSTFVVVSHGCDYTPSSGDVSVHPIEALGSASYWYVDTITSTQFTIRVDANPGQDVDFAWSVNRH